LDLANSAPTHTRIPDPKPCNALLGQGRVEDALLAKLFRQAHGAAKDSTKRNVFAEYDCFGVGGQCGTFDQLDCADDVPQGISDGLIEVHLARLAAFACGSA
jgi:hypothetical protein